MKEEQKPHEFELNRTISYQPCWEENSSLLSRFFFLWTNIIIRRGNQKALDLEDLSDLKASEDPKTDSEGFRKIFTVMDKLTKNRTMKAFRKHFGMTFFLAGFLAALSNSLQFAGPLMINKIL